MCDLQFIEQTWTQRDVLNNDYHAFYTSIGFDHADPDFCSSTPGQPVEHTCCGGTDKPFQWIGLNKFQCCPDGTVVGANDQC